ncbi:MAG: Gx transporter family protein [Sediminispirochaetaceae bacterium]
MTSSIDGAEAGAPRLDTIALFAAISLFLSIVELVIPKPFPFFRLGLANLPLLIALTFFQTGEFLLLVMLKIFGQAIVAGTLFSYVFLFSAVGSVASGMIMLSLRRAYPRWVSLAGISVAGAFGSNCAQLLFAAWLIFGRSTRLIAPPFLLIGTISGILLGLTAGYILRRSRWLRGYFDSDSGIARGLRISNREERAMERGNSGADLLLLWSGLIMIPPFILQPDPVLKAVQTALFLLYGGLLGKRVKILPGVIIVVTVTAAAVLSPLGEVLLYAGSFPVTEGALFQGLTRGLNLVGMVYLSRCTISSRLKIPGKAGRLFYRVFFYFEELSSVRLEKSRSGGLMQAVREKLLNLDQRLLEWSTGSGGAGEVGGASVKPAGVNDSGIAGEVGVAGGSGGGTEAKTRLIRPWLPPAMVLIQYGFFFLQKFG